MALTEISDRPAAAGPGREEVMAQVRRMLSSPLFQGSEWSRQLLTFLAQWALDHPGQHAKESEIAVSVFHRQPGAFDSQTDSVVRVQMARLRTRMLEYFTGEGQRDDVVLEIPKGSYQLVGRYRQPREAESAPLVQEPELLPVSVPVPERRRWELSGLLPPLGLLAAGLMLGAGAMALLQHRSGTTTPRNLRLFWDQVLAGHRANLVVFSNPRLAGTLITDGLRYYHEATDAQVPGRENLSYTGAGDPLAVSSLTHLFDTLRQDMKVRSGATLSWDQAKESNLIFIGRPEQNPALRLLPRLHEFYFKTHQGIINAHPGPGEPPFYKTTGRPYTHDYAVIAYIPGFDPTRHTLILAGNTTYGSQAAAEFVSSDDGAASLVEALHIRPGEPIPYFEGLLEVRINQQIPIWRRLVSVRRHATDGSSWEPPQPDEM